LKTLSFRAPPLIKRLVGRAAKENMDVAYARLCLPWLAAVALTFGEVRLGDFTPERLGDPAILSLARRISVEADGSTDPAAFTPLVARATMPSGEVSEVVITAMLGAPSNPLTLEQHMEKARRCLAHAGLESAHASFAERVLALESAPDTRVALAITPSEARMADVR
jgi:2-methylcitrate dehydratase PrpD